jgi:hypothetical protein
MSASNAASEIAERRTAGLYDALLADVRRIG